MSFDKLLDWSQSEFSHLPWRVQRTLYRTLVSEIMLQQTTVSTVLNHFERFLKEFPTLKTIARASEEEMLIAWKGLGYYRRAKNLKKIAEYLTTHFAGEIPLDYEVLISIPGIGPYTASALIGIGANKKALAVDANLERVIARLYGFKEVKGPKLQQKIQMQFQDGIIFKGIKDYRGLNEALMDLGRTNCQARRATCELCFLRKNCQAFAEKKVLSYPVEAGEKKVSQDHELGLLRLVIKKKNQILAYQKSEGQWLSGQYEIPTFIVSTTDSKLKQYPKIDFDTSELHKVKTSITKYKITNFVLEMSLTEFKKLSFPHSWEWINLDEKANLSTASMKVIAKIKNRDQE